MITIIDSGGANIASILFALERLNVKAELSADPDVISKSSHVILPGVGAAKDAMASLHQKDGLIECITSLTQPVLGICLGMQLLFSHSDEGDVPLLGIIKGDVQKFDISAGLTIPHMGWNAVNFTKDHDLVKNIDNESYFYFVHSYKVAENKSSLGLCDYISPFTAIVAQDNFMGCQFHPERSSQTGSTLLKNFCTL